MDGKVIYYEKEAKESVQAEFNQFYGDTVALDSISVYRKAYEIHSKNLLYEYGFCGAVDFPKEIYRALYEDRGNILKNLFEYLHGENVYSSRDVEDSITGYCEERYFDLMNDVDYKHEVIESVDKEFKASMTDGKTLEEVFDESYEIHIKTAIKDAVCEECLTPEIYKALYQKKGEILQTLYDGYQADPSASVTTNTDAEEFIERYCNQNYPEIMNGEDAECLQEDESPVPAMGG